MHEVSLEVLIHVFELVKQVDVEDCEIHATDVTNSRRSAVDVMQKFDMWHMVKFTVGWQRNRNYCTPARVSASIQLNGESMSKSLELFHQPEGLEAHRPVDDVVMVGGSVLWNACHLHLSRQFLMTISLVVIGRV